MKAVVYMSIKTDKHKLLIKIKSRLSVLRNKKLLNYYEQAELDYYLFLFENEDYLDEIIVSQIKDRINIFFEYYFSNEEIRKTPLFLNELKKIDITPNDIMFKKIIDSKEKDLEWIRKYLIKKTGIEGYNFPTKEEVKSIYFNSNYEDRKTEQLEELFYESGYYISTLKKEPILSSIEKKCNDKLWNKIIEKSNPKTMIMRKDG